MTSLPAGLCLSESLPPVTPALQAAPAKVGSVFPSYQSTTAVVGLTFQDIQMPSGGTYSLREWPQPGTGCRVAPQLWRSCVSWVTKGARAACWCAASCRSVLRRLEHCRLGTAPHCCSDPSLLGAGAGQRRVHSRDQEVEHDGGLAAVPSNAGAQLACICWSSGLHPHACHKRSALVRLWCRPAHPVQAADGCCAPFPCPQSTITFTSSEILYRSKMCIGQDITWSGLQVWVETAAGEGDRLSLPDTPKTLACL